MDTARMAFTYLMPAAQILLALWAGVGLALVGGMVCWVVCELNGWNRED